MSIGLLTKNKESRESNFELLRVIAMILILFSHFAGHGYFQYVSDKLFIPLNNIFFAFLLPFGKLGVILFILITGYFLINSNAKIKSFLNLFFQTLIYSTSILIIFLLNGVNVSHKDILASIMPVTHSIYWFITAYLILYILIPIINKFLKIVEKKNYETLLLAILTILYLFIHNNISSFIYLYILGSYIRKSVFPLNKLKMKHCIYILCSLFIFLILYVCFKIPYCTNFEQISRVMHKLTVIHSPILLISSVCIFNIIKNLKFDTNPVINSIAISVLPVYLIHENFLVRPLLWENVMKILNQINSNIFLLLGIFIIVIIFINFILIDKLFGYLYLPIRKRIVNFICKIFDKISSNIRNRQNLNICNKLGNFHER